MLVMFPMSFVFVLLLLDALHLWRGEIAFWSVGLWVALAGAALTLVAMIPGVVDLAGVPNASRAHRVALYHTIVGTLVLVAYAASAFVRWPVGSPPDAVVAATVIDALGVVAVSVQGWLGGELVYKHHLGVRTESEGAEPTPFEGGASKSRARERQREA